MGTIIFMVEDDSKEEIQNKLETAYKKLNDIRKPEGQNDLSNNKGNLFGTITKKYLRYHC